MMRRMLRLRLCLGRQALPALAPVGLAEALVALLVPALVDFYMQGRFPIDKIVTYYPFDRIGEAFDDSSTGTTIKPILRF